jgi:predicted nucleic acid-binding protein
MSQLYVVDSCAMISYFADIIDGANVSISQKSLDLIDRAFYSNDIKLIFPVVTFIELFEKWFKTEESAKKLYSEIYLRISNQENMEIQPLDKEILENFAMIKDIEQNHNFDNHDKQVLASAMTMQCTLITSDGPLKRYNQKKSVIPAICD